MVETVKSFWLRLPDGDLNPTRRRRSSHNRNRGNLGLVNEEDDDARVHSEGTALAGNMYLPEWLKVASLHNLIFQYGGMDKLVLFIRRSLEKVRNKIGVHDVRL